MRVNASLPPGMHLTAESGGVVLRWPGDLTLGASGGPWSRIDVGGDLNVESPIQAAQIVVGGTLTVRGALSAQRVEAASLDAQDATLVVQQLHVRGAFAAVRSELRLHDATAGSAAFGPGTHGVVGRWSGPHPRLPCAVEGPWSSASAGVAAKAGPAVVSGRMGVRAGGPPRWPGLVTREGHGAPASPEQRARGLATLRAVSPEAATGVEAGLSPGDDLDTVVLALLRGFRDARAAPASGWPSWLRGWVPGPAQGG